MSLALGAAIACTTAGVASAQAPELVAEGLANPRGLTFGPGGDLFVTEAGSGGSGQCVAGPEGGEQCLGATGALTRVDVQSGRKRKIVRGLPSLAPNEGDTKGQDATGPQDVSFDGRNAYFTVGLGGTPELRARLGRGGRALGALWRLDRRGNLKRIADLADWEAKNNPDDGQPTAEVDSNPYSVDASVGGRILVTDAGGNSLVRVSRGGAVTRLAIFPFGTTLAPPFLMQPPGTQIPYQPVPTGVVRGDGGRIFVGTLTGFPFPVGAAALFRYKGGPPLALRTGFTTIVDIAAGPDRTLYVLQISTDGIAAPPSPGRLFKLTPDGQQAELAAGRLTQPTGMTVGPYGDVYVANQGSSPNDGQIVRIAG
jgi:hypothetical protein